MKTLKLFNAVVAKKSKKSEAYVSKSGYIIEPEALWAKKQIIKYLKKEKLNATDLNKSFYKSWKKIKKSTRWELLMDQIAHYFSTYGTNFQGEAYIPGDVLDLPETKIKFVVIKAIPADEMREKCLSMLRSGLALTEETIDDLISVLTDELNYVFTGNEQIKNKEAIAKIADYFGIYPEEPVEFFRYVIYKTTGKTLLIKNNETVEMIKTSAYNPAPVFNQYGLEKMAEIFNRYKPLFLAYKNKCPKTINKISKLSKTHHRALIQNPLNSVT